MLTLEVITREPGAADELRAKGSVPAVLYGPKESSTAIAVDERKLEQVWKQAGHTSVVVLKGAGEDKETLIRDIQFHPVSGVLVHADFYVLEKGKKVRISVPLEFSGIAPAEKAGNVISKAMHELEIEVAPAELPHRLVVDLTTLTDIGSHITAGDVVLPPSATLITDAEEIVASATAFVEEQEQAKPAAETVILTAKPEAEEGAAPAEEKK